MSETLVFPVYLMVDVSFSMGGRLAAVNQLPLALQETLARNPILEDNIRFSLIDFADDAQVRLPLCDLLDPNLELPMLTPRGAPFFASAFEILRQEIDINVAQLRADGYAVHRPIVWFVSDGQPIDNPEELRRAFDELISTNLYPYFIPCVTDPAGLHTMARLIHPPSGSKHGALYVADPSLHSEAIAGIGEIIVSTLLQVGYSVARGRTGSILPPRSHLPPGITQYDPGDVAPPTTPPAQAR